MNNLQRLYNEVPEYKPFRAVTIINANLLVDVDRMEFQPNGRLLESGRAARPSAIAGHHVRHRRPSKHGDRARHDLCR